VNKIRSLNKKCVVEIMGIGRGFKSFVDKANRGFKQVASAAKRGHKFVQEHVKSVANADAMARKAANTLHSAGEYAEMGSRLVGGRGGDTLRQAGEYMSNMGSSIHNFRRGELANRARQDFGNNSIMNA